MWREDGEFGHMLRYLEKLLSDHGVEWCAPGGTINRHFYYMVQRREDFREFMDDINIRVVLDPICDEVMRRLLSEDEPPKRTTRKKLN